MRSAVPLTALAVAAVLLLGGCVPDDAQVAPPPAQTTEPIFASDEEALAAATEAYEAYQSVLNEISQEGGSDPGRIAPVVTTDRLEEELAGLKELAKSGRYMVGAPVVGQTTFQQQFTNQSGVAVVVIYVCVEPSGAKIFDKSGSDVTPTQLHRSWPREAVLEGRGPGDSSLLLADEDAWEGTSSC